MKWLGGREGSRSLNAPRLQTTARFVIVLLWLVDARGRWTDSEWILDAGGFWMRVDGPLQDRMDQ